MLCAVKNPHFLFPIQINPRSPHAKIACSQLDLRASMLANRRLDPTAILRTSSLQALHNQRAQGAFFITAAVVAADCSSPPPKPPPSTTGKIPSSSPAHEAPAHSADPSSSYTAPPTAPTAQSGNTRSPYAKSDSAEVSYPRYPNRPANAPTFSQRNRLWFLVQLPKLLVAGFLHGESDDHGCEGRKNYYPKFGS